MKKTGKFAAICLLASAALTLSAVPAFAGGQPQVDWSISIGSPGYPFSPPPAVYVQPQAVYVQPQRIYVQPQPVYLERPPAVYYSTYGRPYYVRDHEYRRFRHHRHGRRHHDEDDED